MKHFKWLLISSLAIAVIGNYFFYQDMPPISVFEQNNLLLITTVKIIVAGIDMNIVVLFLMSFISSGLLTMSVLFIKDYSK
ncbi:hypothetical protein [uncultured Tenacibaculum sp.]|uniref:hypothetical protein n=1 Tax=uncultured Tenacibaculum sp. TaxID=174713 RepID=UPI002609F5B9|nr:hypothetical protein [uncultured Tenacibaculum sp.]